MSDSRRFPDDLCSRLLAGEVAALSRCITLVDSHEDAGRLVHQRIRAHTGNAEVVGITGAPGVGKSTLIDALIRQLRSQGDTVAVVAVDPSSPMSGGSVLGDRTRMGQHTGDRGVFVRSIASRGHLGGLATSVDWIVDLLDAAGWNVIIIETVGAGQSETEVAELADVSVVVNAPGLGDDIQAIKAGILEIADVLVVNKADSPLAAQTELQLRSMLGLRRDEDSRVAVVSTIATEGSGICELLQSIRECSAKSLHSDNTRRSLRRARRTIAQLASEQISDWVLHDDSESTMAVLSQVVDGECDPEEAARALLAKKYGKDYE